MKSYKIIEEEIETFTKEELRLWGKGYLAAIEGIVEHLNSDQIKILNKILLFKEQGEKEKLEAVLESRLTVLDAYETHYRKRLRQLERDTE